MTTPFNPEAPSFIPKKYRKQPEQTQTQGPSRPNNPPSTGRTITCPNAPMRPVAKNNNVYRVPSP